MSLLGFCHTHHIIQLSHLYFCLVLHITAVIWTPDPEEMSTVMEHCIQLLEDENKTSKKNQQSMCLNKYFLTTLPICDDLYEKSHNILPLVTEERDKQVKS